MIALTSGSCRITRPPRAASARRRGAARQAVAGEHACAEPASTTRPPSSTITSCRAGDGGGRWLTTSTVRRARTPRASAGSVPAEIAVDGVRRLVEDEHLRIAEQRARERDPLALPARQPHAVVAEARRASRRAACG